MDLVNAYRHYIDDGVIDKNERQPEEIAISSG
jgi:hypothetical protein